VQLSGQLFANTQIPCALWFLSKNRAGENGYRDRRGEVLFIDGRRLGSLIPGSRKQKQLSDDEVKQIAVVYRQFKREGVPEEVKGFCRVATVEDVRGHRYALTPGRYVGSPDGGEDEEEFEVAAPRLAAELGQQMQAAVQLDGLIRNSLADIGLDVDAVLPMDKV
jgi:type I restriction enzyme M protein